MTKDKTSKPERSRSSSEKRKPSTSPEDKQQPKSSKALQQSKLFFQTTPNTSASERTPFNPNISFNFSGSPDKTLTPENGDIFSSTPVPSKVTKGQATAGTPLFTGSPDKTIIPGNDDIFSSTPVQSKVTTSQETASTPPFLSTSVFDFINDASSDVLTSKLSSALMLPQLQLKFQQAFMKIAKEVIYEHVQTIVNPLHDEIDTLRREINPLKTELAQLRHDVQQRTDELEQYSRRNTIRIAGAPEDEDDNTETTALGILQMAHERLAFSDIDRVHRVGRREPGRGRDILVKFLSYWDKNKVIAGRRRLKLDNTKIYINEDLTQYRSKLYKSTRDLRKAGKIEATWTRDGRIYILEQPEGATYNIKCQADLDKYTN